MELRYYLNLLRRWWWVLILSVLVTAIPAYLFTQTITPTYRANVTVFVNIQTAGAGSIPSDVQVSERLVQTYSEMARQPVVFEEVRDRMDINLSAGRLLSMTAVEPRSDTQLFTIAVTGQDPSLISDIANTTAEVFIEQQQQYLPEGIGDEAIRIAQPALEPDTPVAPNLAYNVVLAALAGLGIAGAGILLWEYLDDTVKSPEQLESAVGIATLGMVALNTRARKNEGAPMLMAERANSPSMEAYRLIRTNLEFASIDRPSPHVVITSANPGEGKTTTLANLAIVIAQTGKRVIALDADLRKPAIHRLFGVTNGNGFANLLLNESTQVSSYIRATSFENLWVIPSGPLPPNPAELLASDRLLQVLAELEVYADIILIDSPPALAVADPVILASRAASTILVVDSRKTRPDTIRRSVETVARSGTSILGAVLNKLTKSTEGYYYYYGYYGAPPEGSDSDGATISAGTDARPMAPAADTGRNQSSDNARVRRLET